MTTLQRITVAELAAKDIVERYRTFDPEGAVVGLDFGGGSSNTTQDTTFARSGTSQTDRSYDLPAFLSALIQSAANYNPATVAMQTGETNALLSLITQAVSQVPGLNTLQAVQGIDPTSFNGSNALTTIAQRNPYSTDWENSTSDLYNRVFTKARAEAQSGPANVRGGTARAGFELADLDTQQSLGRFREVRDQQNREAGIVQNAVQLSNAIESMRRGSQLQGQEQQMRGESARAGQVLEAQTGVERARASNAANLQMASTFLGKPKMLTTDSLAGRGTQVQNTDSSNWNAGLSCCFIFLEVLNGVLPPVVRRGRDEFATGRRVDGYRWMALWLVPLMQRGRLWTCIVNVLMVQPFIRYGLWHYERVGPWWVRLLRPWCYAWFAVWTLCSVGKDLWHLKT